MKTLDEALQTIVKVQTHSSMDEVDTFIQREGPGLVEADLKYNDLRIELFKHLIVQEFLYCIFQSYAEDYEPMLNVVFYFGVRVGMEMEKNENIEGFLPEMGELP